jgi:hypothetical protein
MMRRRLRFAAGGSVATASDVPGAAVTRIDAT